MIYVFLANGFEEIEALAPVDFLLRAGVDVKTVGVSGKFCRGAHGINVEADILLDDVQLNEKLQGIILPGGMPGAENLNNSEKVQEVIGYCAENNKIIGAICAAPFIIGRKGLLKGKNATCFPGFEGELIGASLVEAGVVTDGTIVTAKGAGVAWEFGAAICSGITGEEKALEILRGIQWRK
ncbi:MAG: DJ-1/PfpI family protein [Ruminococcaceae bacterium]|nr:DJ-1/PfpI family protein [Oscillospiraceae bacterium]